MKYYSVDIQVDFAKPREIPPPARSGKPWAAVGYFQYFYCSERSKERAQELALGFVRRNEELAGECRVRCIRVAWMRTLREREEIAFGEAAQLTEAMFAKKDEIGIWFHSEKGYYVSELDAALDSEAYAEGEHRSRPTRKERAAHGHAVRLAGAKARLALNLTNFMVTIPLDGEGETGVRDCLQTGDRAPSRRDRGEILGLDPDNDRGAVVA